MMSLKVFGQECSITFLEKVEKQKNIIPVKSCKTSAFCGIGVSVSAALLGFQFIDFSIGN